MYDRSANIARNKVFLGVIILCLAVFLMLIEKENVSIGWRVAQLGLLGLGAFFYLWGRFFSRRRA